MNTTTELPPGGATATHATTTFAAVAQEIATIQQRRFAERTVNLLAEIKAATATLAECEYTAEARAFFAVGVLKGMLTSMAALDGFAIHASCFDSVTTEAVKHLVEALEHSR